MKWLEIKTDAIQLLHKKKELWRIRNFNVLYNMSSWYERKEADCNSGQVEPYF